MAQEVQRRGGTTSDHSSFTGADREWTHDDDRFAVRLHDGSQVGGYLHSHDAYVESIPDTGTDVFEANFGHAIANNQKVKGEITSANTTTTPTLENTWGTPSGPLTVTTRDGSALWAGALSGVHEFQLNSGGTAWLVLDPVPQIPDSTQLLDEDDMSSDSATDVASQQSIKAFVENNRQVSQAWVNFDGTGTVSIRDDYNVDSITDNGTGDYTVNFTNALADTNYTVLASSAVLDGSTRGGTFIGAPSDRSNLTATSVQILCNAGATASADALSQDSEINVGIFGGES